MINWPEKLITAVARRRCVLFLGAGVSANATNKDGDRPPTWKTFLEKILADNAARLASDTAELQDLINNSEYLIACEIIVDKLGESVFGDLTASAFRRPGYKPSDIHKAIFGLDSRIVISPNVDKIYEDYASSESASTVVVKSYSDRDLAKYIRSEDYLIIRAHGSVDETAKMIFTHGQYSNARIEYSSFYRLLDALILTHTFLFIGCGINDPDIQLVLENANFSYKECPPHYFLTAENAFNPGRQRIICKNRNLEMLTYENPDGSHANLLTELNALKDLVEKKRGELSGNYSW